MSSKQEGVKPNSVPTPNKGKNVSVTPSHRSIAGQRPQPRCIGIVIFPRPSTR